MTKLIRDSWLIFGSTLRTNLRNPAWIFIGLFQPICYMLLFAPLLKNLSGMPGFPSGSAYDIFTPGLMVMMALFGTSFAGFGLISRLREGVVERWRVTPVSRLAIILGGIGVNLLNLAIQIGVLVAVGLILGFHPHLDGLIFLFVLIMICGLLMAACSYALALTLKDEESLAAMVNLFAQPLMLLSGITLPLTLAPQIIRNIAKVNPFSYAVDAARALVIGHMTTAAIPQAFAIFIVLAALGMWWATRSIRQAAM